MHGRKPSDLGFEVHFAADIASNDVIDLLQSTLATASPRFCESLRVLEYEGDRHPIAIDPSQEHALRNGAVEKGVRRGALFERLASAHPPTSTRRFGTVLIRGASRAAHLMISFDEHAPLRRAGESWLFSNSITARVASRVDGSSPAEWVASVVKALAKHPTVLWGAAYSVDEFRARNLHEGSDGTWALGRNARASLPGLFWMNVFGPTYRTLIGQDRLADTPVQAIVIGDSLVLSLYPKPREWENFADLHRDILRRLGTEYFFDRAKPNAFTVAPEFEPEDQNCSNPN